ncbi:MAG: 2,3-bisphosphoglycerate-independent phosphoglycerate mutase [Anaerolineae bacterium]|nr:2,3-bisphosphoglycerate-independent phosphoglycerate mutase [Anaerolineae bacterium]MCO5196740.1 2,3-bisphosphoglycerate-independent phosphoglycerate mutase [Anaerolineae bacterium]
MNYKPVALIICDGWGIRETQFGNSVTRAHTPNFDRWLTALERSIVDASEEAVGLTKGQMGNSEVGHLNLGAGRVVYQDIARIDLALRDGSFYTHPDLLAAIDAVKKNGSKLHLLGLLGPGGVHSHSDHLFALLKLAHAHGVEPIVHVITDGRDTPPTSSLGFLSDLEAVIVENPATIASVSGRYYAMDRDHRWQRTEKAYRVIVNHEGVSAESAQSAIEAAHAAGVTDEFIVPVPIDTGAKNVRIEDGDAIVTFNFRADRMRQIVRSLCIEQFDGFERDYIPNLNILTFTEYEEGFPVTVLFSMQIVDLPLAEVISNHGFKQVHAAETEKYPHVTFFFNGRGEEPFSGEDRILIPSPKVATYDLQPEMSAYELTEAMLERIATHDDAFILVNFANPDMVGHTGVLEASTRAVEVTDECAGRLVSAVLAKGGAAIVTADHGNAERMINRATGQPHTYHTTSPVSLFVILPDKVIGQRPRGKLADVAPTVLELMGLEQPPQMTGESLIAVGE